MRIAIILLSFLIISSCSTITRFDQTCITCVNSQRIACKGSECPTSFMVGEDCLVTIVETGENIYLNEILKQEKINPRKGLEITIAKLNGRYFLACNEFENMWILTSHKRNTAKIKSVKMPSKDMGITSFELYSGQLKMISQDSKQSYLFDEDKEKWQLIQQARIGD